MRARALIDWPLGAMKLATGAKSFENNPWLSHPSLKRGDRGLHVRRALFAERMADRRREQLTHLVSAEHRASFRRDGFVMVENALPPEQFERVREEAMGVHGDVREMRQGPTVTRRVTLDPVDRDVRPWSVAALQSPLLQGLVRYVASHNARPLGYVQSIIATPPEGESDPQTSLHFDTFHSIAKSWLFLHDVGEEDGPFAYVPGSHRMTPERCAWEQAQAEAITAHPDRMHRRGSFRVGPADLEAMGLPAPRLMAVPANTLVVADTHGAHGRSPITTPTVRVELYASLRRSPFALLASADLLAVTPAANRPAHTVLDALEFRDRIRRSVGSAKVHPWRPVSARRMDDPKAD
ncbi:MAG: phytanoyl-CoA dioxygenase family protein [Pseudomonadota bacterium]